MAKSTSKAKQTKKKAGTVKSKVEKKTAAKKATSKKVTKQAVKQKTTKKSVTVPSEKIEKVETVETVEKNESANVVSANVVQQPSEGVEQSEQPTQRLTKTYLTKEELKHFEQILLQKRAEVLRDLEIMRASLQDENNSENINSSYAMHMADHGTETLDREQRFMFIARDERYLSYIDKALERIKNGTYGICVKSGLPIPKERLEAVPHTAVRIEYKNR